MKLLLVFVLLGLVALSLCCCNQNVQSSPESNCQSPGGVATLVSEEELTQMIDKDDEEVVDEFETEDEAETAFYAIAGKVAVKPAISAALVKPLFPSKPVVYTPLTRPASVSPSAALLVDRIANDMSSFDLPVAMFEVIPPAGFAVNIRGNCVTSCEWWQDPEVFLANNNNLNQICNNCTKRYLVFRFSSSSTCPSSIDQITLEQRTAARSACANLGSCTCAMQQFTKASQYPAVSVYTKKVPFQFFPSSWQFKSLGSEANFESIWSPAYTLATFNKESFRSSVTRITTTALATGVPYFGPSTLFASANSAALSTGVSPALATTFQTKALQSFTTLKNFAPVQTVQFQQINFGE